MKNVATILRTSGIVPVEDLDRALDLFGDSSEAWRSLVDQQIITEEDFFRAVAEHSNLEFVDLTTVDIPPEVISLIPGSFIRESKALPLRTRGDHLFLAIIDPSNLQAIDDVSSMTEYIVAAKIVTETALNAAINKFVRADEELDALAVAASSDVEVAEEEAENLTSTDGEAPVVRLVNLLIAQAVRDRASDIHIEPGAKTLRVRYRIDGVLHEMQKIDKSLQQGVLSRLKIMSNIDISEKRKPQDGRMSVNHGGQKIDVRVASLPTVWGEKIVMRILDHSTERRSLASMGMDERDLEIMRDALSGSHGMILVTGPTGSGKSTTLYTSLDEVSTTSVNVITVEDPVEKRIEGVNQVQINNKAGMTFPAALKSILRADPDVVMIGEIRDEETATIAVEASLTGHLVLSTLHTNGAPESLVRLVEMGVEPYLVSTSVSAILAQRLARKLCGKCKVEVTPDETLVKKFNFPMPTDPEVKIYGPVGCSDCANTGYLGRIAIVEILRVDEELEKMVIEGLPASKMREHAQQFGFKTLKDDGFRRVLRGETTIEEVLRVAS